MSDDPFKRDEVLDKPGIVGARWWHEGLVHSDSMGRRAALQGLLVGGGLLAAGLIIAKSSGCGDPDTTTVNRSSLDVQREFGWSFGARSESLTFDGTSMQPFEPNLLATLPAVLTPIRPELRPYYIPTLFQSSVAVPRSFLTDETAPFVPVVSVLRPIFTPAMAYAFRRGKALAALLASNVPGAAVVVDLPGPDAVAFAAGAANVFEPVFAIDNWPHPRGVVPAHLTLAAAAYYQPLFAKAAAARTLSAPAMFVLDRARLAPYQDETKQFDNRHLARLPQAAKLEELGIKRILYVVPLLSEVPEMDDLNDDFVQDAAAGITVKIVAAEAWSGPTTGPFTPRFVSDGGTTPPSARPDEPVYYGGTAASNDSFWADYPWRDPPVVGASASSLSPLGRSYVPVARTTPFSGSLGTTVRASPAHFGTVPVLVSAATGAVIGSVLWRTTAGASWGNAGGSWGRSSGGWGG